MPWPFLAEKSMLRQHRQEAPGYRVLVIGGGNVAIDAARVARRLGAASEVTVVYRRSAKAKCRPTKKRWHDALSGRGHRLFAYLTCAGARSFQAMTAISVGLESAFARNWGLPDEGGRRRPVPVEGSRISAWTAMRSFPAIGQKIETDWAAGITESGYGHLAGHHRLRTAPDPVGPAFPHVFAAGDAGEWAGYRHRSRGGGTPGGWKPFTGFIDRLDMDALAAILAVETVTTDTQSDWAPMAGDLPKISPLPLWCRTPSPKPRCD